MSIMLHIYNTLSRKLENFKPLKQNQVKVYFCGPTPYDYAHIGNLKTYVFEDYVIKTLKFFGYNVKTTMNITDIDDKTIRESQRAGEDLLTYTRRYTGYFLEDLKKLNIALADNIVPISTLIDEMVLMINGLIKKGYAYLGDDGSIYYSIKKFKKYGRLAHLDFSGMKAGIRINNDEYDKENVADFALWKAYKKEDGENYWEKEFYFNGEKKVLKGRPGWHIECSACNLKYFGAQIDIHMGGVDNIFPHHENEIAQSEGYTGKTFSKYWIHGGHVTVNGKKMSKSEKNFYTIRDLEEKFAEIPRSVLYRSLRLLFMNARYRENVDFSFEKLNQNFNAIKKIDEALKKLDRTIGGGKLEEREVRKEFRKELQSFIQEYCKKLEDDFNMPEALAVFFSFITFLNSQVDNGKLSKSEAESLMDMLKTFNSVLSIIDFDVLKSDDIPDEILRKFEERNALKKAKNFALADALRAELLSLGYKVIDDRNGSRIEKIGKMQD